MSTKTQGLAARSTDVTPTSDLGTFEIVRRLPVTTWSLRPALCVPKIPQSNETLLATRALGRLSGWMESASLSEPIHARLAARYARADSLPAPRVTTAWLGAASDGGHGVASVPPPPAWLPSILKGWNEAVSAVSAANDKTPDLALRCASWTMWLFAVTQPFGTASGAIASANAARILAVGSRLPFPMVAGTPVTDTQRATQERSLASALTSEQFAACHRTWMTEVAAESERMINALSRMKHRRAQLVAAASSMRAPKHCVTLAESLVAKPITNVADAALRMDVTFRAAQAIVDKFVSEGILREITGRRRDRVFQCDPLSEEALFTTTLT